MKDTIYIVAPANISSGGPELLHQLCHKLNKNGYKAKMYYTSFSGDEIPENPVHDNYIKYNNPYTISGDEVKEHANILILPEVSTELALLFDCKVIIWWLSVDNYVDRIEMFVNVGEDYLLKVHKLLPEIAIHMAQSYYAYDFLLKVVGVRKEKIYYLSDYLREDFLDENSENNEDNKKVKRENLCLYNPKKGYENIAPIIENSPELNWTPILNMTPKEVANLMSKAKVYIDFGNHPGKDRIPREAAIKGCCVITNKKGSAAYQEDVCIPEIYKFKDTKSQSEKIISLIKDIYDNYEKHAENFNEYRSIIRNEEKNFDNDMKNIFSQIYEP